MARTTTVPEISPAPDLDFDFDDRRFGRVGTLRAVRRHWIIALVPVVVLLAAAAIYSARRAPTYTASTDISTVSVRASSASGLPGVLSATQQLATTYSRAIGSDAVKNKVGSQLHISPDYVAKHVTATAVPESPVLKVEATAPNRTQAIAMANASAAAVIATVKSLGGASPTDGILRMYRDSQRHLTELQQRVDSAHRAYANNRTSANAKAIANAVADAQVTSLHVEAIRQAYQQVKQSQGSEPRVQILTAARDATTDRLKKAQLALFIALVAGLAIGAALATLRANLRARRALHG
jgi:capsular polysaccharide biosynthesis protein